MSMRRSVLFALGASSLVVFGQGCGTKADPRLVTPKSTVKVLMQAMYDNDLPTVRKCIMPGDDQLRVAEAMTAMNYAMRRATDSAYARFRDELNRMGGGNLDATRVNTAKLDAAPEVREGDSVLIQMSDDKSRFRLRPVGKEWRADMLGSFGMQPGTVSERDVQVMVKIYAAQARGADKARAEIDAGAYSSAVPAVQAIFTSMAQEMETEKARLAQEMGVR